MVQAIHTAVAGRARFKVEGLYRSKSLEKVLEYRLVRLTDISHASANALTGNVLVCFNSGNTPLTIASLIEKIVSQYQSQPQISGRQEPAAAPEGLSGRKDPATVLDKFKDLFSLTEPQDGEVWHQWEAAAVLEKWQTSRDTGLSLAAVQKRRQKYGLNLLPEAEPRSGWEMFFDQFKSLPVALLGAAAGSFGLYRGHGRRGADCGGGGGQCVYRL